MKRPIPNGGCRAKYKIHIHKMQVPVAAWSKVWFCGLWPTDIVGSNPTGGMDVCLSVVVVLCCQVEVSAMS